MADHVLGAVLHDIVDFGCGVSRFTKPEVRGRLFVFLPGVKQMLPDELLAQFPLVLKKGVA